MNQEIIMEWYDLTECLMLFKRRLQTATDKQSIIFQAEIALLEIEKNKLKTMYNIVET